LGSGPAKGRGRFHEQAAATVHWTERDTIAVQTLVCAEEQAAVVDQSALEGLDDHGPSRRLDVGEDVAAEDDVKTGRDLGGLIEQVGAFELDDLSQLRPGAPLLVGGLEPAKHGRRRQAALDLESGVGGGSGAIDGALGQIRSQDIDIGAGIERAHREGPGLLAVGATSRPDAHETVFTDPADGRQEFASEGVERSPVAAKPGFAVQHGLDNGPGERSDGTGPERSEQGVDAVESLATSHGREPMFGQMDSVAGQAEAGPGCQQRLEAFEIVLGHA
jgi:hypothetical protein